MRQNFPEICSRLTLRHTFHIATCPMNHENFIIQLWKSRPEKIMLNGVLWNWRFKKYNNSIAESHECLQISWSASGNDTIAINIGSLYKHDKMGRYPYIDSNIFNWYECLKHNKNVVIFWSHIQLKDDLCLSYTFRFSFLSIE